MEAMYALTAERGFDGTTVPGVVARARVSRNAFYECFTDKVDCFLAGCDEIAADLLAQLEAMAAEPDWLTALRKGIRIYLRFWEERPAQTRSYLIELPVAGERAIEQRARTYAAFRAMFAALAERARHEQPELPPITDAELSAAVFAPTELVAERVRAGRGEQLGDLADELLHLLVKLLADDATAQRARQSS